MTGQSCVKYFIVSDHFLVELCKGNFTACGVEVVNPLPQDAKVVRIGHDSMGRLNVVVESQEFEEIEDCGEIPRLDIQFHKLGRQRMAKFRKKPVVIEAERLYEQVEG